MSCVPQLFFGYQREKGPLPQLLALRKEQQKWVGVCPEHLSLGMAGRAVVEQRTSLMTVSAPHTTPYMPGLAQVFLPPSPWLPQPPKTPMSVLKSRCTKKQDSLSHYFDILGMNCISSTVLLQRGHWQLDGPSALPDVGQLVPARRAHLHFSATHLLNYNAPFKKGTTSQASWPGFTGLISPRLRQPSHPLASTLGSVLCWKHSSCSC